jgi:ribonuclease HI
MDIQRICKNCGAKLIQRATKRTAAQLKKPYYYTAYYFCPNCHRLYHDEKFKVTNISQELGLYSSSEARHTTEKMDSRFRGNDKEGYHVSIWTDGACVYNGQKNARAAWAFVSDKTEQAGLIEGKQTNNVAEALAIYYALKWAVGKGYKKIKIYSDSQITLNNFKKSVSQIKNNREIFAKIADLITNNALSVHFEKVTGHSGDINNERADMLANQLAGKTK